MLSFANDYNNIGASCIGYVLTFTIAFMIRGCFRASQATHPPTQWEPATPYRPCAQHYSLGVITSGIALPIAGRLPPILLSTFLSSRIRSSTGGQVTGNPPSSGVGCALETLSFLSFFKT